MVAVKTRKPPVYALFSFSGFMMDVFNLIKLCVLIIAWCSYVLDCLFVLVQYTIIVLNFFEILMGDKPSLTEGQEGFSSEEEVLSKEDRIRAIADRFKRYPWQEET